MDKVSESLPAIHAGNLKVHTWSVLPRSAQRALPWTPGIREYAICVPRAQPFERGTKIQSIGTKEKCYRSPDLQAGVEGTFAHCPAEAPLCDLAGCSGSTNGSAAGTPARGRITRFYSPRSHGTFWE